MRRRLFVLVLIGALVSLAPTPADAQISNTGPAGLARQMPRIYGPYMANASRIKNQQKKKHRRQQSRTRPRRTNR